MKHSRTLLTRIFIPLLIVAILQSSLMYAVLHFGGVFSGLERSAVTLLREQGGNTSQPLISSMTNKWINTTSTEEILYNLTKETLDENGKTFADLKTDSKLCTSICDQAVSELIYRLRTNGTTGIFLVFLDECNDSSKRSGVYLRTASPDQPATNDSDLQLVRGLPSISRTYNLSLSSFWEAEFKISDDPDADLWYRNPLAAAESTTLKKNAYGAYWCPPFQINGKNDVNIVTWSIPLLDDQAQPYAVLGIELNVNYLASQLHADWQGEQSDFFLILGTKNENNAVVPLVTSGSRYKQFYSSTTSSIQLSSESDRSGFSSLYRLDSESIEKVHGVEFELPIYPGNSPFADEQWVLIIAEGDASLYGTADSFTRLVLLALSITMLFAVVLSYIASRSIVSPITKLVNILKDEESKKRLMIPPSGIKEIDRLGNAISSMTADIIQNSRRTSQLIELSGLPVGVFELRKEPPMAYCSDGFLKLAGHEDLCGKQYELTPAILQGILDELCAECIEPNVYHVGSSYLRIVTQNDENSRIGSVLDITSEIEEKQRIEYERDFDSLTHVYNRRAFETQLDLLFSIHSKKLKTGAMLMMDLDNLKFLNDTYGHDCGDAYICALANVLSVFNSVPHVIARRSGDEFYAFLYGFNNKNEALSVIHKGWDKITNTTLALPDGTSYRLRLSGGISWYPMDSLEPNRLVHYADFAMYWVKHNHKGDLDEFRMSDYTASSYLVNGQDALNRLIDDQLVHFAFQPILSCKDGNTIGYEILMRSDLPEFRSPEVILRLAKSQGKLHYIEHLTWNKGLKDVAKMRKAGALHENDLIFLNSIANQTLFPNEQKQIMDTYKDLLPHVVMEITEGEDNNKEFTRHKLEFMITCGGSVAIDDFGTGYNSELALISIPAQIVKIDISFIRNVDQDIDKQLLIKNLIRFARQRSIAVLAEGVETEEEMNTLMDFGVDYMQGYYFARPADEPKPAEGDSTEALRAKIKSRR